MTFVASAPKSAHAPLCPVNFMSMKSEAHFTGVAPADSTGVGPEDRTGVAPVDSTGVI